MSLTLVPQAEPARCGHCGAATDDVPVGVPEGWEAAFSGGAWLLTCPDCQVAVTDPVFAVHRPQRGDVALFVRTPDGTRVCELAMAEARHLHATLGNALALAANPGGLAPSTRSGQAA